MDGNWCGRVCGEWCGWLSEKLQRGVDGKWRGWKTSCLQ